MIVERILAKKYYGSHATGVVILVNGHPTHLTDKKEADAFINTIKERNVQNEITICN